MKLTDIAIRKAKPQSKPYKLADGDGMFLLVHSNGSKYWRLKYRLHGKEKLLALGTYPEVTLENARAGRLAARKLLAQGLDPSLNKREEKQRSLENAQNSFEALARSWHAANQAKWTPQHGAKILRRLEQNIFPEIGARPLREIKPAELLAALRTVEKRGATELSHRLLQNCSAVFRFAIAESKADYNPAADLGGALKAHKAEHYPTIAARMIPEFLAKLATVETTPINKLAIRLVLHTFLRQGELRRARWEHIDWQEAEWHIPAEHTKMRVRHVVPLATQTLALLRELQRLSGGSVYLFPSQQRQKNPIMSENTINVVIKRMGYDGQLVGHGFRALASTTLNEHGHKPDVIERQLAHAERNKVRAAYNRAQYLPERRQMMQWWADYLEGAAKGAMGV